MPLLFSSTNSLWTSDGTAVGTHELTGITGAYPTDAELDVVNEGPDMTVFNGKVLFAGRDATSGTVNLWATDGTSAGTAELNVGNTSSQGMFEILGPDLTVFNGEVLFAGASSSDDGLWVTDGSAAGTHELTGISGTGVNGLFTTGLGLMPDLTVFNNKVMFQGTNASGDIGLWVTDGTSAGTSEVTGISGADPAGIEPFDMTVFNGKVLFEGEDASFHLGLWVTDGTGADTQELTGISGANSNGLDPSDITVFNGAALFAGIDASSNFGLWVTDGTAAGTHELTGISGANSQGVIGAGQNPDMTIFNNEVFFDGVNAAGQNGLWVSDGTAAGTHEITGIGGVNANGLDPTHLTAFNGELFFNGVDTGGQNGLWVTDGTAAGTHEITGISGVSVNGLNPLDLTVFNSNSSGPIVWAAGVSGDFALAANWNPASVPGAGNDAAINPSGTYTVTSSANETVNSLTTASGATLDVAGGNFTVSTGTGAGRNVGTLKVDNGGTLTLTGSLDNTGAIVAAGGIIELFGAISDIGSVDIGAHGFLELNNGSSIAGNVAFTGIGATLQVDFERKPNRR